jgi:hypothetical protein
MSLLQKAALRILIWTEATVPSVKESMLRKWQRSWEKGRHFGFKCWLVNDTDKVVNLIRFQGRSPFPSVLPLLPSGVSCDAWQRSSRTHEGRWRQGRTGEDGGTLEWMGRRRWWSRSVLKRWRCGRRQRLRRCRLEEMARRHATLTAPPLDNGHGASSSRGRIRMLLSSSSSHAFCTTQKSIATMQKNGTEARTLRTGRLGISCQKCALEKQSSPKCN